jgi:hypothetical protein
MTTKSKPALPAEEKFSQEVETAAETLLRGCSKVKVRFTWFGTSAKIDDEVLGEMMGGQVPADVKDAISASKRLLKSKHPALTSAKEAYQAIKDYFLSMTVPLVAVQAADAAESDLKKDAGVRLIEKKHMKAFDERMKYLVGLLGSSAVNLQKAMPEIKAEDKKRLDKVNPRLYNENDYTADVTKLIGVNYNFEPVGVDADWEHLCPEIYEREKLSARKKFEAVVETAAAEFASRFVKYVRQVVDQLGNRVRLNPMPDALTHPAEGGDDTEVSVNVSDAEVMTVLKHDDEPDEIPEGHVLLKLRLAKGGKGRSVEVWLSGPMPEQQYYTKLRPYETKERKKLYESTVDNLKGELEAFINIGTMLGPYKNVIEDSVGTVKKMLSKAAGDLDTGKISEALREGSYFRNEMKGALEGVAHNVQESMGSAVEKRRSVSRKLMGKV